MPNAVPYGFVGLKDNFDDPVSKKVTEVSEAIDKTLEEHNRQLTSLFGLFIETTTEKQVKFRTPATIRLSGRDEYGRALPSKGYSKYDVAFPLQKATAAIGRTYDALQEMTVKDMADHVNGVVLADIRWVRDHILAALFNNAGWTWDGAEFDDPSLTIRGLANGDATEYQIQAGKDAGATDNHYLAQANAIDNTNDPYPGIVQELREHPENGGNSGECIALIPTNLKSATEGLTAFYPVADPRIRSGANVSELIASLGVSVPGKVVGYHQDGAWIVEWPSLPNDYVLATTTQAAKPIRMREKVTPALQGFRFVATRNDHPFLESHYDRIAGFGAWNRVGAVVKRIGNASYAIPAGYESPMA